MPMIMNIMTKLMIMVMMITLIMNMMMMMLKVMHTIVLLTMTMLLITKCNVLDDAPCTTGHCVVLTHITYDRDMNQT